MNVVVFGAGAIGCHVAYCLYKSGFKIFLVSRGQHYKEMKSSGLYIEIKKNDQLLNSERIFENNKFVILDDIQVIKEEIDFFFITVKLKDYENISNNYFKNIISNQTAIIPPCTNLPYWWLETINNKIKKKKSNFNIKIKNNLFDNQNIIGMTMWLSSVLESPGNVLVRHVQRGYPLKEIFPKMENKAKILRKSFNQMCISPEIKDIHGEIFTKSLNALAFNLVALDREFNNYELKNDLNSITMIKNIMNEGEQITDFLDIKLDQTAQERIDQTLSSSAHTMSMLNDYKNNRKVELQYVWNSYKNIINELNIDMNFTKKLIDKVLVKIENSKK